MAALTSLARWHDQQHASAREQYSQGSEPLSPAALPQRTASGNGVSVKVSRIVDEFSVLDELPGTQPSVARQFANIVAAELKTGNILPYSNRQHLVRTAERMGLGRFDANLIIALIQNRLSPTPATDVVPAPTARQHWLAPLALILAIEGLVAAYIFWLLVG